MAEETTDTNTPKTPAAKPTKKPAPKPAAKKKVATDPECKCKGTGYINGADCGVCKN